MTEKKECKKYHVPCLNIFHRENISPLTVSKNPLGRQHDTNSVVGDKCFKSAIGEGFQVTGGGKLEVTDFHYHV